MSDNPLVPVTPPPNVPPATAGQAGGLLSLLTGFPKQAWDSMKPTTDKQRALLYNAKNGAAKPFDSLIGQEVVVSDVSLALLERESAADGEMRQVLRTMLFTPTGEAYAGESLGVGRCLAELMRSFGEPTWDPPLRLRLVQIALPESRRMFRLEFVAKETAKGRAGGTAAAGPKQ